MGRRIKEFYDISQRPVYREIRELLEDMQTPMTVTEIINALFPLHSTSLSYQTYPPEKVKNKYYPTMTYSNLYIYLQNLHKFGLIKKTIRISNGEIEYRSINFEEVHKLFTSPPRHSLDDIIKNLKQNDWHENFINEKFIYLNLLEDMIDEMNGIKNSFPFKYKKNSIKKIEKLKIIIELQIAIINIQISKNEKTDDNDTFRRINEIENFISEIAGDDINLKMILETEQLTELVMEIANQNKKEIEENNCDYTYEETCECKITTNCIIKNKLDKKTKEAEKEISDFLEKTGREMDDDMKMTTTFSNGKTIEV